MTNWDLAYSQQGYVKIIVIVHVRVLFLHEVLFKITQFIEYFVKHKTVNLYLSLKYLFIIFYSLIVNFKMQMFLELLERKSNRFISVLLCREGHSTA